MKNNDQPIFRLENFEGPLPFLLHLVQKQELEAEEVYLRKIIDQYLTRQAEVEEKDVDDGAEFIGTAATLLWLKSKLLLPDNEQVDTPEIVDEWDGIAPHAMIPELIDYCRFKYAARGLSERELIQQGFYVRGKDVALDHLGKPLGIEHVSINELASIFQVALQKATLQKGLIQEEEWKVSDKIGILRDRLIGSASIPFEEVFSYTASRIELVVTFLAVLELMKLGEISVGKERDTGNILIIRL